MRHPRRFARAAFAGVLVATLAAFMGVSSDADADEAPTADALFRAGRAAMQRGDYADAASRLAESQRLEPAPGTLLNLAIAEDKLGRVAAAWEHARSAAEQLPASDERHKVARDLFTSLDKRVPRIVLRAKGLADGARVKLDDAEVRAASFGLPIPVDPGEHRITVEAPGRIDHIARIRATEGSVTEQALEVGTALVGGASVRDTHKADGPERRSGSTLRTAGFVTLGVGAASAIGGGVFGLLAIDRNSVVESHCSGALCDVEGAAAARDGRTFAGVSTGLFIGAGVLALAGVLLVVLAPRAELPPRARRTGASTASGRGEPVDATTAPGAPLLRF